MIYVADIQKVIDSWALLLNSVQDQSARDAFKICIEDMENVISNEMFREMSPQEMQEFMDEQYADSYLSSMEMQDRTE